MHVYGAKVAEMALFARFYTYITIKYGVAHCQNGQPQLLSLSWSIGYFRCSQPPHHYH